MGGRGGGNEGWKRDYGAKVIFFGGRRVHMVFRRMKGDQSLLTEYKRRTIGN